MARQGLQGGAESPSDAGGRRRRRRETNTLSDVEYCDGQIDYLENVVTPMFEAYSTFTSFSFRDEVLDRAGENLAAWREGVATAKHAETTAEMRRQLMKASGFCMLCCVWFFTRWNYMGKSDLFLPEHQRGGAARCSGGDDTIRGASGGRAAAGWDWSSSSSCNPASSSSAVVEAVSEVRDGFIACAFSLLLLAAACMASVSPFVVSAAGGTSRRHKERLLSVVTGVYVFLRVYVIYRRHTLTKVLSDNGVNTSFPFMRGSAVSSPSRTMFTMNVLPVLISVAFYRFVPHHGPRVHAVLHSFIPMCRMFVPNQKQFVGAFTPRGEEMVDRTEMTWVGHLLFPFVICVLDPASRAKLFPRWLVNSRAEAVSLYVVLLGVWAHYQMN
jgi:hypothetical protein